MTYTPSERLERIWRMAREDPDCIACNDDVLHAQLQLERWLEQRSAEDSRTCHALPVSIQVCFDRITA